MKFKKEYLLQYIGVQSPRKLSLDEITYFARRKEIHAYIWSVISTRNDLTNKFMNEFECYLEWDTIIKSKKIKISNDKIVELMMKGLLHEHKSSY